MVVTEHVFKFLSRTARCEFDFHHNDNNNNNNTHSLHTYIIHVSADMASRMQFVWIRDRSIFMGIRDREMSGGRWKIYRGPVDFNIQNSVWPPIGLVKNSP